MINPTAAREAEIQSLIDAVRQAEQAGHEEEADRVLDRALAMAPDHSGVLNAAGMRALRAGRADAALKLLERAVAAESGSPVLLLNLAVVHRALRNYEAERDAVDRALATNPRFFLALLHKARLLEQADKIKQSVGFYDAFLANLPANVMHPPAVRSAVAHAKNIIAENHRLLEAFVQERLIDTRARHAGARLDRFDACLDVMLGKRRHYAPQPTSMLFPRLPAVEFFDRELFPWLDAFEAAADEVCSEARDVWGRVRGDFAPYIARPAGTPVDQWQELNNSTRWSSFHLMRNGTRIDEHAAHCPRTAALLDVAPLCDVPGHAPSAFFSALAPKTRIPAHHGVTNTRAIVHLALVIPPSCGFRVGAERREWNAGKAWVFDDTFEHEAWNDSDELRIILIFDIWNPFLSAAERDCVSAAQAAAHQYYGDASLFTQGL